LRNEHDDISKYINARASLPSMTRPLQECRPIVITQLTVTAACQKITFTTLSV